MLLMDVPEGEYVVFEHGPFDYEQENDSVAAKVRNAMDGFDFAGTGYEIDPSPGRVMYFYHDEKRFFKYVKPVRRT